MTDHTATLILACSTTVHYVLAMVMFVYARHYVRYLSIAWIMAIFAFSTTLVSLCGLSSIAPGMLHPMALIGLAGTCYLQSIYPLSFVMPGYLQWQRMWKYASPVIVLVVLYILATLCGGKPMVINTMADLRHNLLSVHTVIRLASLVLSMVYIANIFCLPRRLTNVQFPRYLIGYSVALGVSAVFYAAICIVRFNLLLATTYIILLTLLNTYLCMRTLESMALELPKPTIQAVEQSPNERDLEKERDFNEANQKRFERVEYWMQHNVEEWKDYTFGRDQLCRHTGINRHLMLQCVRSKGYNNVHDYISFYRIAELKRMTERGEVSTLQDCLLAGFGSVKTVRNCFLRCEGASLENFLAQHVKKK